MTLGGTHRAAKRALPASCYGDADVFARERASVFSRSWRLVAHETMLQGAGAYATDDGGGVPIVVVRGADGRIRAFTNICRHRAGPLVNEPQGRCEGELVCRYHGWRYALDGRLKSARDFGSAGGFDARDFALEPVRAECWRGFWFVNRSSEAPPVCDLFAPLESAWSDQDAAPFALRRSHRIACDWKVYVENYLEGYHVPLIHPRLDAEIDSSSYRVEIRGDAAIHTAPSRGDEAVYSGLWAWVWPWLGINLYRHGAMMERITPEGPLSTRLDYLYFFDPARIAELEAMLAVSDEVTAEDKNICERVQANLSSGAYRPGVLSPRHEMAIAWFHDRLRATVGYVE